MKRKKKIYYMPYNFDFEYEIETYKNIGRDYGDEVTADMGFILNKQRKSRKQKNHKRNFYKEVNTYEEWKSYIKEKYEKTVNNNFLHYITAKKRGVKLGQEMYYSLVVPIDIAIAGVVQLLPIGQFKFLISIFFIIFITAVMIYEVVKNSTENNFYTDLYEILSEQEK